jgi:hypothetical protein
MCIVLLPPGGYPIAVKKIYHYTYNGKNLPKTFHNLISLMNPSLMAGNLTMEILQQVMLML